MENDKYVRFNIFIKDIIPQQHYLSLSKLNKIINTFDDYKDHGDIFVIKYKDKIFSVDGHHRLFHMSNQGVRELEVVNEIADNDNKLYQILADQSLEMDFKDIRDLADRILESDEEYKEKWVGKCQGLLKDIREGLI
ncbi:hypothetical protein PV797_05840 [Clostridiaceae bacterium M8S5]|nr:hypothetical protein PV797_05840 [Clostridiaceae bacterium M8S5]